MDSLQQDDTPCKGRVGNGTVLGMYQSGVATDEMSPLTKLVTTTNKGRSSVVSCDRTKAASSHISLIISPPASRTNKLQPPPLFQSRVEQHTYQPTMNGTAYSLARLPFAGKTSVSGNLSLSHPHAHCLTRSGPVDRPFPRQPQPTVPLGVPRRLHRASRPAPQPVSRARGGRCRHRLPVRPLRDPRTRGRA